MARSTRSIQWIRAARRDFDEFPRSVREHALDALTAVAEGAHPPIAKPLAGFAAGVLELVLRGRGAAYRVVYVLHLGPDVWVVHAFQKKSKSGIATPKSEIDLIREPIKRLREL